MNEFPLPIVVKHFTNFLNTDRNSDELEIIKVETVKNGFTGFQNTVGDSTEIDIVKVETVSDEADISVETSEIEPDFMASSLGNTSSFLPSLEFPASGYLNTVETGDVELSSFLP